MAFLDNSGDIILDAVLTETGRRRMAAGNFKIEKFALGDDEIDYSLYNKNHPSGSAYFDLDILQTPVFEAFTQVNAGINYGLLPTSATDLLYLPIAKVNELSGITANTMAIASSGSSGLFMIVDSSNDTTTTTMSGLLTAQSIDYVDGSSPLNYVLFETGLDTGTSAIPVGTDANRTQYLVQNNLIDRRFLCFVDNRFINSILGLEATSKFSNDGAANVLNSSLNLAPNIIRTNISSGLENYVSFMVAGIKNGIVQPSSGANTETTYSNINGPRGSVGAISPVIKPALDAEYTLYGGTTTIGGTACQFIDTTIYVQGESSPAQIQIPIRIIRIQ